MIVGSSRPVSVPFLFRTSGKDPSQADSTTGPKAALCKFPTISRVKIKELCGIDENWPIASLSENYYRVLDQIVHSD